MRCARWLVSSMLLIGCRETPAAAAWQDPSQHIVRLVRVDSATRLETLDWGGQGPTIVMLAGLGNTAHVYDRLALQLTDSFHVIGITRRGFGASDQPPAANADVLVADLTAVLDSLGHRQVILVGHSLAGDELSGFATLYPERATALVYLDAAHDRSGLAELFQATPLPPAPPMTAADSVSPASVGAYANRVFGTALPEGEVRAIARFDSAGRYLGDVTPESVSSAIIAHLVPPAYARITSPALAIYAHYDSVHQLLPWYAMLDSAGKHAIERAMPRFQSFVRNSVDGFRNGVADNEVLEIPGAHHYVFLSHEAQTLSAVRAFLSRKGRRMQPQ